MPSLQQARRVKRARWSQQLIILFMLMLAWAWIGAAIVVVWHSSTHHGTKSLRASGSSASNGDGGGVISEQQQRQDSTEQDFTDSHVSSGGQSPLLMFTCRRAEYLRQTLEDVLRYLPRDDDCRIACPLIVSQDGNDESVAQVVSEFQDRYPEISILHWKHSTKKEPTPYHALARHYEWALKRVFAMQNTQRVIILEEDLHISPDFFSYFETMAPLLDSDETLLAVSAFNDNGIRATVKDPTRVLRSDFFPGLGWMMTKRLWEKELAPKWPKAYWDDWLREPAQRQDRHILRPEVRV